MELMAEDKIPLAQQPNFTYNLEGRHIETLEGNRLATNNAIVTPVKKYRLFMPFGSDNLPIGRMVDCTQLSHAKARATKCTVPARGSASGSHHDVYATARS